MKTKTILLLCGLIALIVLILSCQKEEVSNEIVLDKQYASELAIVQKLLPENVELVLPPENEENLITPNFSPEVTINLEDCKNQQCDKVLLNYINQMKRVAEQYCKPISVSICCCKGIRYYCWSFMIYPERECAAVEETFKPLSTTFEKG